jgi:hypothetical protein
MTLREEDALSYARRDWNAIEAIKRAARLEQLSRMTPSERLRMGDALRNYAKALHPDWPTDDDRKKDLAVHLRVSESLRSVATARGR